MGANISYQGTLQNTLTMKQIKIYNWHQSPISNIVLHHIFHCRKPQRWSNSAYPKCIWVTMCLQHLGSDLPTDIYLSAPFPINSPETAQSIGTLLLHCSFRTHTGTLQTSQECPTSPVSATNQSIFWQGIHNHKSSDFQDIQNLF